MSPDPCPRHDHDAAHTVAFSELSPPCGCRVTRTILDQVMHRQPASGQSQKLAKIPAYEPTEPVRCGVKGGPAGASCYFDRGHSSPHHWEPKP